MSGRDLEIFLARIYVDPEMRARFRTNPAEEASNAGLSPEECSALKKIDWTGLEMASRSFHKKRRLKPLAVKNTPLRFAVMWFFNSFTRPFRRRS